MASDLLPVIRIPRGTVTPHVLTVGDPERAASIAGRLDGSREVGSYREYVSFQGTYQGVPLTVTSHGVGGSGAAVAFEELIQGGARTIIRLGTCGAYLPRIRSGDLLVATGAVREEGVSTQLLPLSYPAISDLDVTRALIDAANATDGVRFATGVMLTKGVFYPGVVPDQREIWSAVPGLVGVEMELATLLIVAALRGVRAGGAFTVDGNPAEEQSVEEYNPHRPVVDEGKQRMVTVGLEAAVRLARQDAAEEGRGGPS